MKTFITVLILFIFHWTSFGQNNLGVTIQGGFSQIESYSETNSFHLALTGIAGLSYNYVLSKKSLLNAELIFQQMEDKSNINFNLTDDNGNNVGSFSGHTYKQLSYLGIQCLYGYKINKLTIQLGLRISRIVRDYLQIKGVADYNGSSTNENLYNQLYLKHFDLGPVGEIQYNLNSKFAIDASYYYGLNNISKNSLNPVWRIRQLTIGLRYTLITKK